MLSIVNPEPLFGVVVDVTAVVGVTVGDNEGLDKGVVGNGGMNGNGKGLTPGPGSDDTLGGGNGGGGAEEGKGGIMSPNMGGGGKKGGGGGPAC